MDPIAPCFPPDRFGAVLDAVPLRAGMSGSPVHAVTTARGAFVLKVHPDDAGFAHALAMQRRAAAIGVAPAVAHADAARRAVVSVAVRGVPLGAAVADPATRAAASAGLVALLGALRAAPIDGVPAIALAPVAAAAWGAQAGRAGFPAWAREAGARLDALAAGADAAPRRVFAHADLNPNNALWDGERAWLVDWERAGAGHPDLDLATVATFLRLPDEAVRGLLARLEGVVPDEARWAAFRDVRALVRLVYGAVFLGLVPDLAGVGFAAIDATPDLAACYAQMMAGALDLGSPRGQAMVGAALLKEAATS